MEWYERIKKARLEANLTRAELIERMQVYLGDTKVSLRALVTWESGESEPRARYAIALARALGHPDVAQLFFPLEAADDTPQLNQEGLDKLEEYRQLLLLSDRYREHPPVKLRYLPVYLQPASAGTGQWLDDAEAEQVEVDGTVPTSAEFGIRLAGNSMEPRYANGQIVWVKPTQRAETGDIVICVLNGQGFCKKLEQTERRVALISLNPEYDPIVIHEGDELRIVGKVVG